MTQKTARELAKAPPAAGRSRWSRFAALGLLMAALAPIILIVAGLITGLDMEDLTFFLVPAIVGLVAALLVWRFGTWAKVLGIVIALGMGMMLFWLTFGLQYVESFADFTTAVVFPLGIVAAIVGSIAAIVRRRRLTARAEGGERRAIQLVVAVAVLAALVSGVLNLTGRESVDARGDLTVRMFDFEFDKESYTLASGRSTVLVRNSDAFAHTFTIDDLGIDEIIIPGSEKLIEVEADEGEYILYCVPHTSDPDDPEIGEDMAAEVVVR